MALRTNGGRVRGQEVAAGGGGVVAGVDAGAGAGLVAPLTHHAVRDDEAAL